MADRGVLLMPPEPPPPGTIEILMPPTVTWRVLRYRDVTKVEIDLEGPFVDKAPREIWAGLLALGIYLCSIRTMYRLLAQHGDRFDSFEAARAHCCAFFDWYNNHHFHTGIALLTPFVVHHGLVAEHQAARQEILDRAHREHPERFVHRRPTPPALPEAVYINPPKQTPTPISSILNS